MTDVVADSRALILRASHILVVTIRTVDAQPSRPRQPNGEQRRVALGLSLDEVVKGTVAQPAGSVIKLEVTQIRAGVSWRPLPGLWTNVALDVGAQLVAFSRSASEDAAVILNEPAGERIVRDDQALGDVHLVAEATAAHLDLRPLTARAMSRAAALGFLFAEYLWARYEAAAMANLADFDVIATFLEEPALDRIARTTLLSAMLTTVESFEPPALRHIDRLAIALFRMLALPQAADLYDNLVETYLPNLLGLSGGVPRPAAQVFHARDADFAAARAALRGYRGTKPLTALLAWLNAR